MKLIFGLFFVASLVSGPAMANTFKGMTTHVRDGDTIEVSNVPIRLNGVTCDEAGTRLGNQATKVMRKLVSGQRLTCSLNGEVRTIVE